MIALIVYCASFCTLWALYVLVSDFFGRASLDRPARAAASDSIPVVGLRNEWFKVTRASLRQLTHGVTTLMDGYRQVRTNIENGWRIIAE